ASMDDSWGDDGVSTGLRDAPPYRPRAGYIKKRAVSARSLRGMFMQKSLSTSSWAYGAAIPALALAFILGWQLGPIVGAGSPYLMHLPAVVIAAYFDGLRTGLLVTFVAAIAANAQLAGPPRTFLERGAGDRIALALFALSGALISGLGESLRRARRHNLSDGQ